MAVAQHQSAGRGRLGRTWEAPAGASLLASVLLRPQVPQTRWHLLSAAVALAACDALEAAAGLRPSIKWPNDLVVDDLKLAGILAEAIPPAVVVVGIGCNLNWPADALVAGGTAVNVVTGMAPDRDAVLAAFLDNLAGWYADLGTTASAYRQHCGTIGRLVRVEVSDETFTGRALDVDNDGHLLVDVGACVRTVAAGDVIHVRTPET